MAKILPIKNWIKRRSFREELPDELKQSNYLQLLSEKDRAALLEFVEFTTFPQLFSSLKEEKVLLVQTQFNHLLTEKIVNRKPQSLLVYQLSKIKTFMSTPQSRLHQVRGGLHKIPVRSESIHTLLAPLCNEAFNLEAFIKEAGRLLVNEGRLILSLIHPQFEFMLTQQNKASAYRPNHTLQSVLDLLRQNNFYLENLTEGRVGKESKSFFVTPDQRNYFDEFEGMPLVLNLRLAKYHRG